MADDHATHWLTRLTAVRAVRIALLSGLGLLLLFRVGQVVVAATGRAWGYDFSAYWFAAQRVLSGEPVYAAYQLAGPYSPQEQFAYLYPPFLAVAVTPLAAAFPDFPSAMWVWFTLGLAVLIAAVVLFARSRGTLPTALAVLLAAILALPPVGFELVMGNVHLLLVGLFLVAWLGLERGTRNGALVAGACVAIAVLIKVFPALILIWFVLTRRYLAAGAALVTVIVLAVATFPIVGVQAWLDYPQVLLNVGPPPDAWSSFAPASILAEFVGLMPARLIVIGAGVIVLAWAALRKPAPISFAVALMVSISVVPTMYPHYLALVVAPLLLFALYSPSGLGPVIAYVALFIGGQVALLDLSVPIYRALALLGLLVPLAVMLLPDRGRDRGFARRDNAEALGSSAADQPA
jgi:hypothetical protein